jgi:hypothetical protein
MSFIEKRSSTVFLKACSNLCEIEHVKVLDAEMKVTSEYKVIKLKENVLKDYIAKSAKESTADLKVLQEEKDITTIVNPMKSGLLTGRVKKEPSSSSIAMPITKDSFLRSCLKSTKNFLPKPNRKIIIMIMDKIVDKFCAGDLENWSHPASGVDIGFGSQYLFSYASLLTVLNKIVKAYPSTASLILLFKSNRLIHFSSFVDFLVRKIYPIGFLRWLKKTNQNDYKLEKLEEFWKRSHMKDTKIATEEDNDTNNYIVTWDRNVEWESIILENVKTLIEINIFMSPQEKKLKLDIKKYLISGLIDKTLKLSPFGLKNVVALCTSLILLPKLLTTCDSKHPSQTTKDDVSIFIINFLP